ncbi:hypothetical protein C8046_14775 [Serinibacter arcticus]|uniref:DUF306 domain-containing protein n=1 Tax=Serinibacter arcticus TaxID=1655435 RepID=A0A2U1ZXM7_9MICO|nr:META domain-containing protein [Serinibacter arcticus]PWD51724.1 hypothetical protein C8046_14775 [Serinibacter arcticus]
MSQRTPALRRPLQMIGAAVLAVGLAACTAPGGSGSGDAADPGADPGTGADDLASLEGVRWTLESGTVDGEELDVPESPVIRFGISREGETVSIAGTVCNSVGGELVGWPDVVEITGLASTEIYCEQDGLMELEAALTDALPRVTAMAGDRTGLVLTGDGVELVFDEDGTANLAADPVEAFIVETDLAALEGLTWTFGSGTVDGEALVPVEGHDATLTVTRQDDVVSIGGTVCNTFGGTLVGWPDAVHVTEVASTRMMCTPEALMDLEAAIQGALPRIDAITGDAAGLTLTGDGVELVYTGRP